MLNSFEISDKINGDFTYNHKLNDELIISYSHDEIFNTKKSGDKTIISYGYCFDVREPETNVNNTLKNLINNPEIILDNIKYLNGHFILLFNFDGKWNLVTDAVGITPVYFDPLNKRLTTDYLDGLQTLNGVSVLNLEEFTISRIEIASNKLTNERIERVILDLVTNQYKYFLDKNLTLNFRRNKMNKAIISIMNPALIDQSINLRENDEITLKLSKWISREYKMNILPEDIEPSTEYLCNTHLMDYSSFMNKETKLSTEDSEEFNELYKLDDNYLRSRSEIEFNLINNLKYRNETKPQLIYDPFNVLAIQEVIYDFNNNDTFEPLGRIIKILHPAIDFYDFAEGITLMQKYEKLKKQNEKMSKELKKVKFNQDFLNEAQRYNIKVSENLNGKVLDNGVTIYPVSQVISKEDIFELNYPKEGPGMLLVESYFDNPKNAHRIKVELNDEIFNIDEFLNGKFIKSDSGLTIKMYYERNYDAASWQKAGKITVKEIE